MSQWIFGIEKSISWTSCVWLTLACCQIPTQPLSHSPSSATQRKKMRWKDLWFEIKTGKSLTSYHHGQNRFLIWGKFPSSGWSASWDIQFFTNCTYVGLSHRLQSFRIDPCGLTMLWREFLLLNLKHLLLLHWPWYLQSYFSHVFLHSCFPHLLCLFKNMVFQRFPCLTCIQHILPLHVLETHIYE